MTPRWQTNPPTSYADYFRQQRPAPPHDKCKGITLSEQTNSDQGDITENVVLMETSALSFPLTDTTTLDIAFVKKVLSSSGPVLSGIFEPGYWQWNEPPNDVVAVAVTEQNYYPWLEWVVFRPAVHAVAAVRDQLYMAAAMSVPPQIQGITRTQCLHHTTPRGTSDIIALVAERCFAPHEIKRTRVLGPEGGKGALKLVVELASGPDGYHFRNREPGLRRKIRRLMCQVRYLAELGLCSNLPLFSVSMSL